MHHQDAIRVRLAHRQQQMCLGGQVGRHLGPDLRALDPFGAADTDLVQQHQQHRLHGHRARLDQDLQDQHRGDCGNDQQQTDDQRW